MNPVFQRTARVIGEENVEQLGTKKAAVFGLGGVGSYAAEALVRAGVGHLAFIDKDQVEISNLNRQLVADLSTLGRNKADVMVERARRICPDIDAESYITWFRPGDEDFILSLHADFIVDAIDDVPAKISLASICARRGIPEISSMGMGNRLHPEMVELSDIYKTSGDPLAKKMRKSLRALGVKHLPVVFSTETPRKPIGEGHTPGSTSFVPPVGGMIMAAYVVRQLLSLK